MGQELTQANETLLEFERLIQSGGCNAWEGTLRTGVDLGTANIVLAVVDEQNRPVAEPLLSLHSGPGRYRGGLHGGGSGGHTSERTAGGAPGRHAGRRSLCHPARHP